MLSTECDRVRQSRAEERAQGHRLVQWCPRPGGRCWHRCRPSLGTDVAISMLLFLTCDDLLPFVAPTVRSPFLTQSKCSDTLVFLFYEWTFYDKMLGSKTLCWVQEFRHWWVHTVSGPNTEVKNRASPHGSQQTPVEKLICPYALLEPAKLLWQGSCHWKIGMQYVIAMILSWAH